MSGHSKWSKVKHQKATTDVVKAKAFTKASRAIIVAVSEGGGMIDPGMNFKLRLAIEKARSVNMPKENIDRAIAKGKGIGEVAIESIFYEAYGPGGVALLIEAATENKQRTVSQIKNTLDRHGGTLATPGSVSYQFRRMAVLVVNTSPETSQDILLEIALENGGLDVLFYDDSAEIYSEPKDLTILSEKVTSGGFSMNNAEIIFHPIIGTPFSEEITLHTDKLVDALADLDDIQKVYTNAK